MDALSVCRLPVYWTSVVRPPRSHRDLTASPGGDGPSGALSGRGDGNWPRAPEEVAIYQSERRPFYLAQYQLMAGAGDGSGAAKTVAAHLLCRSGAGTGRGGAGPKVYSSQEGCHYS